MKRYYFDEDNRETSNYSTYWNGIINIHKENIQMNYDNLKIIKEIFKKKYNIQLEWIGIELNQIKITIHRNMKYYYYQFEKDIIGIIKNIQKSCKIKIESAIFEAWESKHNSDIYKYTIKKEEQKFKLIKKKLNIEKWNSKIKKDNMIDLQEKINELELYNDYITIVGNIYLDENNINSSNIQELNEYIKIKYQLEFKIYSSLNTINIFISERFDMNYDTFEKLLFNIVKYIESHYCVVKGGSFKIIKDEAYKYTLIKVDDSFNLKKIESSNVVCPYPTIWNGYLKNEKLKKNWLNKDKIKTINEVLADKYDIMFYLYYDDNTLYFSICTDTYYYYYQFEHDILKIIDSIEKILNIKFTNGKFEAFESRFNADMYTYNFYLEHMTLKFDKSCINMTNFETIKKQKNNKN